MPGKSGIVTVVDAILAVGAMVLLYTAMTPLQTVPQLFGLTFVALSASLTAATLDYLLPAVGWEPLGVAASLGALMAIGQSAAIAVSAIPPLVANFRVNPGPRELIYRTSRVVVATAAGVAVYGPLGGQIGGVRWLNFISISGALITYAVVTAAVQLVREGFQRSAYGRWTKSQIGWAVIQGSLIITWAAVFHTLVISGENGAMALIVPGGLSVSALALFTFYRARQRAVEQLLNAVGRRNPLYPGHAERVLQYSEAIALELGVSERELADVRLAAMLCDIGQTTVPSDFVLQARPLTEEERSRLAQHVHAGVALIARVPALSHVAAVVRAHHEWYNGLGYPGGLSGTRIPICARIIAVADAFTAMTSYRPYRRVMTAAEALDVVEANAGGQFCPRAAAGLKAYIRKAAGDNLPPRPADRSEVGLTIHALRDYVGRAAAEAAGNSGAAERDWVFSGLGALTDLMAIMTSSLDIDRVLHVAIRIMNGLTGSRCGIILLGADGEITRLHDMDTFSHLGQRAGNVSLLDDAVNARAPLSISVDQVPVPAMREHLQKTGIKRLITVPLLCRGHAIGGAFVRISQDRSFNEAELNMLMIVASQVAMAVENARLHSETAARLREISEIQDLNTWIIENTSTGIIAVDGKGIVTLVSRAAVQSLGRIGFVLPEGTGWSYPEWAAGFEHESHLVRCLREGQGVDLYSTPFFGPSRVAYFDTHITVSRDEDGNVIGATDIFHDVSEHYFMEQRLFETEKLSALAQLAGGAAHEIRNPLASVRGFVQLMQRKQAPDDDSHEYLDIILSEIDRIDGIIKELLQLAKPAPPTMTSLPLRRLLDEVCLLMGTGATLQQIDLIKVFPGDLPTLPGDVSQLKQVLINIITNAIQATPSGGRITVDAGAEEGEAWVRVSDTGEGIPADRIARLFEPFYTTKESGTGLGLTVCYSIVRAHGGRIDVDSEPGKGTTFTVRLPLTAATAKAI